ncbi:alpha-1,3-mannosyl-glycoprotein 4-beta-N-acetylglucosaminyltransferase B-like, partial [Notothenia coriiceps]|uniref:Alpha-1,3-mannosyl-glycoprotein 4-beta-N-acetylglucosaminyltransferase B-like n=1 Tax=Notothenia coriiceps TaxID=8208 RepID=A0A6I9Q7W8_9TELE
MPCCCRPLSCTVMKMMKMISHLVIPPCSKMFKSLDLSLIVEFMLMFYKDKPIDWLLDHIMWVKVCNPEKDAKHCDRQKANLRIRFKPSLFQHVGTHSSLAGKIQKLKVQD